MSGKQEVGVKKIKIKIGNVAAQPHFDTDREFSTPVTELQQETAAGASIASHNWIFFFFDVYRYCMDKLLTNYHTVANINPLPTEILRAKEKKKSHLVTYI